MGNRTPLGRPGFLLVEILLVVFVLAVGLTIVVRSFGSSLDALGTSANYTRALLLLEERLWELEAKGSIVPGTFSGGFSEGDGNFQWAVKVSELPQLGLCETQVTVSWEQRGRPRAGSLVTYLKRE